MQKKGQDHLIADASEAPAEEPDSIYNKDKALKELYDESVTFKNSLAELRSNIKSLNSQFKSYDQKCTQLKDGDFQEYKDLKEKIEEEKKRIQ